MRSWFAIEGEIGRFNTGPEQAGPAYDHSYLLLFRNRSPATDRASQAEKGHGLLRGRRRVAD